MQSNSTTKITSTAEYTNWQAELRHNLRDPLKLLEAVGLSTKDINYSESGIKQFPVNVTQHFLAQMKYGDPNDPLLRQVFPYVDESIKTLGFSADPLDEFSHTHNGLIQKYYGRALVIMTGACAIHCRYCFRRYFPYAENSGTQHQWQALFEQIRNDSSLSEIILSGGDPLLLSDNKLSKFIHELTAIRHVKRLRIHTRLPVVLPSRITQRLIDVLVSSRLKVVMVVHANHANELSQEVSLLSARLHEANIKLFNQSVLLHKVNDSVNALTALCERLFDFNIQAYYLHLLDPVQNAAHYAVKEEAALKLMQGLRETLPGYMLPALVKEQAGKLSKTPV